MSGASPHLAAENLSPDGRPDFLVKLGVLLPCTPEDVKQAYLAKVRTVHPDHGGRQEDFLALQEAFERATEYAQFVSGRRKWLAIQIERYVEQEAAIGEIRAQGGHVKIEHKDWLSREIGEDFAQMLDEISEIRWLGPRTSDAQIDWMLKRQNLLATLRRLDLSHSAVTDEGLLRLATFTALEQLNLDGTRITHRGLKVLDSLASLSTLNIRDTRVGSFRAYRLRRRYPDLEIIH
jgi:hypothetical protein